MSRIVPDFLAQLLVPQRTQAASLPLFTSQDWGKWPGPYRPENCEPNVDYVWMEYAMDAPASVSVTAFDRESNTSETMSVGDADVMRIRLERAGWTLQYRTSHKEGFSYLYGRRKGI